MEMRSKLCYPPRMPVQGTVLRRPTNLLINALNNKFSGIPVVLFKDRKQHDVVQMVCLGTTVLLFAFAYASAAIPTTCKDSAPGSYGMQ